MLAEGERRICFLPLVSLCLHRGITKFAIERLELRRQRSSRTQRRLEGAGMGARAAILEARATTRHVGPVDVEQMERAGFGRARDSISLKRWPAQHPRKS